MGAHHEIEFFAAGRQAAYVPAVQIEFSAGGREAALRLLDHPRREIQPGEMKPERECFKERQGERPRADPAIQDAPAPTQMPERPGLVESAKQIAVRSEEHTSELQSRPHLVCRLLLEKK